MKTRVRAHRRRGGVHVRAHARELNRADFTKHVIGLRGYGVVHFVTGMRDFPEGIAVDPVHTRDGRIGLSDIDRAKTFARKMSEKYPKGQWWIVRYLGGIRDENGKLIPFTRDVTRKDALVVYENGVIVPRASSDLNQARHEPRPRPTRLYHVVSIRERDGQVTYMTAWPVTHAEGETIMRKITPHAHRRIQLEEASGRDARLARNEEIRRLNKQKFAKSRRVGGPIGLEVVGPKGPLNEAGSGSKVMSFSFVTTQEAEGFARDLQKHGVEAKAIPMAGMSPIVLASVKNYDDVFTVERRYKALRAPRVFS